MLQSTLLQRRCAVNGTMRTDDSKLRDGPRYRDRLAVVVGCLELVSLQDARAVNARARFYPSRSKVKPI